MVKGALWLIQVVGEGNIFTKEQIREAFPGVSQADRRIRDLRSQFGWVILTSTEDATLLSEQQRFVKQGVPVWDPSARRLATPKSISSGEAQAAMARDDFMCTKCGIVGGESYVDDSNQTAVLIVSRMTTLLPHGRTETMLVTECKRCRSGAGRERAPIHVDDLIAEIRQLDDSDRARLARWVERGRRGATALDRAWSEYRRLPADARDEVQSVLRNR
ncbi:hypothetical protein [Prescottella equi]|uniref:hypothetical protein n=1 Tax=Rhodococcus hoagii TaxID=43767 RepID=UPI001C76E0D8|nr:hypothetical protein [Prescottella equi]BCN78120.1 hypothetical protein RE0346_17800 [Prescottella equi]